MSTAGMGTAGMGTETPGLHTVGGWHPWCASRCSPLRVRLWVFTSPFPCSFPAGLSSTTLHCAKSAALTGCSKQRRAPRRPSARGEARASMCTDRSTSSGVGSGTAAPKLTLRLEPPLVTAVTLISRRTSCNRYCMAQGSLTSQLELISLASGERVPVPILVSTNMSNEIAIQHSFTRHGLVTSLSQYFVIDTRPLPFTYSVQ